MKKVNEYFKFESNFASKHKLNTCNKYVPQEALDKIENGCSLEQLESLKKSGYDIFKYRTQITIHGLFPKLSTRRIGGYVNLTQNMNKSIGVRYNAIDYEKKSKLYDMICTIDKKWHTEHNSQAYNLYKIELLPDNLKENKNKVMDIVTRFQEEAKKIDMSLFFGTVNCYMAQDLFRYFMVLSINISCFYESNFEKMFENISGMTYSDGLIQYKAIKEAQTKEREERERQWEAQRLQWRHEEEEKKRKMNEERNEFIKMNPLNGFAKMDSYSTKMNDILAAVTRDYSGSFSWKFYIVTKSFGRLCLNECNIDGIRNRNAKGREARTNYNNIYVKCS